MNQKKTLNKVEAYNQASKVLNSLYESENGKKFVHHLVYSFNKKFIHYIPFSKKDVFDCLSKSALVCLFNEWSQIPTDITDKMMQLKEDESLTEVQNELDKFFTDKVKSENLSRIAIRSSKTNRIIGIEELQALNDFVEDQIKNRNEAIYKMIRHLNGRSEVKSITEDIKMKKGLEALLNKYKK